MSFDFQHGVVDSNGIEVHYAEHGSGPLVVFVMAGLSRGTRGGIN